MIDERVCRGSSIPNLCDIDDPALNWGDDISDPLLTTAQAARERGRVEIDRSFSNRKQVNLSIHSLDFLQPGQLVAVDEGAVHNGLLKSISLSISVSVNSISVSTGVEVEREV